MGSEKVTQLLAELSGGNRAVVDELTPLIYQELKRISSHDLRAGGGHGSDTLSTTESRGDHRARDRAHR